MAEDTYIIKPTKAYPFLQFTSSPLAGATLFLSGLTGALYFWSHNPKITLAPAKILREHPVILLGVGVLSLIIMGLIYVYQHIQYTQIRYVFSPLGISFEAGINFKGDFVSWKQINDVNLQMSLLQRLLGCGSIDVVCTDFSVKRLLYVTKPRELYSYMKDKIGQQLSEARRIVRG
jgi:hypothetical protein